jgi:hypothetical protein
LFPGAEIEFAFGDGDDDFAAHDLALQMSVGVVLAGAKATAGQAPEDRMSSGTRRLAPHRSLFLPR